MNARNHGQLKVTRMDAKLASVGLAINTIGFNLPVLSYYIFPNNDFLHRVASLAPFFIGFATISIASSLISTQSIQRKFAQGLVFTSITLEFVYFYLGILSILNSSNSGLSPLWEVWPWAGIGPLLALAGTWKFVRNDQRIYPPSN